RDFNHDLLVETFEAPPADKLKDVNLEDKEARNEFFQRWARERAHDAAVNGIYVLIYKKPPHLQVEVGNRTLEKAFTRNNRSRLTEILAGNFRDKKYDEGLLQAVDYVAKAFRENGVKNSAQRHDAGSEWRRALGVPHAPDRGQGIGGDGNSLMGWVC